MKKSVVILLFVTELLGGGVMVKLPNPEYETEALAIFQTGEDCYKHGEYDKAVATFNTIIKSYPRSELVDDAYYLVSLSFVKKRDWGRAIGAAQRLKKEFPSSPLSLRISLVLAQGYENLGLPIQALAEYFNAYLYSENPREREQACSKAKNLLGEEDNYEALTTLLSEYKDTEVAEWLLYRLGMLAYDREEYSSCASYFEELRSRFPNSSYIAYIGGVVGTDESTEPPVSPHPAPPAPPELAFKVETSDTDADGIFEGGEGVSLTVSVTNSGEGVAEGVTVSLSGPDVLLGRIGSSKSITSIGSGETKSVRFSGLLPYDVESQNVEVRVAISESRLGKFPKEELVRIDIASPIVDVDQVPSKRTTNENAYGVVIGISRYREENIPDIPYAENDARVVAQYFSNVLGVPSHQLYTFYDDKATRSDFEDLLKRILPNATQGGKVLYFYYAGHGTPIPDQSGNGRAYLVPYNGQLGSEYKLYSLDTLYRALGELPVDNVLVFVDACFSGTGRSALAPGQRAAVMVEPETETWPAKLRVIAAAKGTETAWDYEDAKHGLFTYYLLDGLRGSGDTDADGYIEFTELYKYIHTNVLTTSTKILLKRQEPVVLPEGQKGRLRIVKVK